MPKINYQLFFTLILILTLIKILFSIYFGDKLIDMEWRIINLNLIRYGEFSYHQIEGIRIPTIYMPPLYPYFLYSFNFLGLDQLLTTKLILLVQCILSFISTLIFYRISKKFFDEQKSSIVSFFIISFP